MARFLFLAGIIVIIASCRKEKTYKKFSSKDLDFINYSKGHVLKFIDTNSVTHFFQQNSFQREVREQIGIYGKTGIFFETYEVSYSTETSNILGLYVYLNTQSRTSLFINFCSYQVFSVPDSLSPAIKSAIINGVTYNDIYLLKAYKNGQFANNTDTATLYHNKEYGVIQLLFPNGKKIIRAG